MVHLAIFKTFHFQLHYHKVSDDLSISQKLQMKESQKSIPQAGQMKQDPIYKSYTCVLLPLRLHWLSKLVSRPWLWPIYVYHTCFCKVTKKLHNVWKLWSSNIFCEFTYRGTDFCFLTNCLCLLLNFGIHICVCCFNKLSMFFDLMIE